MWCHGATKIGPTCFLKRFFPHRSPEAEKPGGSIPTQTRGIANTERSTEQGPPLPQRAHTGAGISRPNNRRGTNRDENMAADISGKSLCDTRHTTSPGILKTLRNNQESADLVRPLSPGNSQILTEMWWHGGAEVVPRFSTACNFPSLSTSA